MPFNTTCENKILSKISKFTIHVIKNCLSIEKKLIAQVESVSSNSLVES